MNAFGKLPSVHGDGTGAAALQRGDRKAQIRAETKSQAANFGNALRRAGFAAEAAGAGKAAGDGASTSHHHAAASRSDHADGPADAPAEKTASDTATLEGALAALGVSSPAALSDVNGVGIAPPVAASGHATSAPVVDQAVPGDPRAIGSIDATTGEQRPAAVNVKVTARETHLTPPTATRLSPPNGMPGRVDGGLGSTDAAASAEATDSTTQAIGVSSTPMVIQAAGIAARNAGPGAGGPILVAAKQGAPVRLASSALIGGRDSDTNTDISEPVVGLSPTPAAASSGETAEALSADTLALPTPAGLSAQASAPVLPSGDDSAAEFAVMPQPVEGARPLPTRTMGNDVVSDAKPATAVQSPDVTTTLPAGTLQTIASAIGEGAAASSVAASTPSAILAAAAPVQAGTVKVIALQVDLGDLGGIDIRLGLVGRTLSVRIAADRGTTAGLLREERDKLTEALRAGGYDATVQIGGTAHADAAQPPPPAPIAGQPRDGASPQQQPFAQTGDSQRQSQSPPRDPGTNGDRGARLPPQPTSDNAPADRGSRALYV